MKRFVLRNGEIAARAAEAVLDAGGGDPLMMVTIEPFVKVRTTAQNARYWASLTEEVNRLNNLVAVICEKGHHDAEARALIVKYAGIPDERQGLVWARSAERAHEELKIIIGIPTSTRLGTKAFSEFEENMEQIMAFTVGDIIAWADDHDIHTHQENHYGRSSCF